MRKENVINNKGLSSRKSFVRDLPSAKSLLNEEQQPCFTGEAEDPGTLRAAKLSGMTSLVDNDNDKSGRPRAARAASTGITPNLMGFTLIELLVVVLIIGILAAVAVPQYKKAVLKSRFTQLMPAVKRLAEAETAYHLANGEYTTDLEQLDFDMSGLTFHASYNLIGDNNTQNVWVAPNGHFFRSRVVDQFVSVEGYFSKKQAFGYRIVLWSKTPSSIPLGDYCVEHDSYANVYGKYCHLITHKKPDQYVWGNWYGRWFKMP